MLMSIPFCFLKVQNVTTVVTQICWVAPAKAGFAQLQYEGSAACVVAGYDDVDTYVAL
jgi:hypothetical protein